MPKKKKQTKKGPRKKIKKRLKKLMTEEELALKYG